MAEIKPTLAELDAMVAGCDRHHYLYHYKSSYQHLCYAEHLRERGELERAGEQYAAAVFQDHQNTFAKDWQARTQPANYDMHIQSNAIALLAVYEATLGWETDSSMELLVCGQYEKAIAMSSARHDAYHKHASGAHVLRGEYNMQAGELDLAIADFSKALDLWRGNAQATVLRDACRDRRLAEE